MLNANSYRFFVVRHPSGRRRDRAQSFSPIPSWFWGVVAVFASGAGVFGQDQATLRLQFVYDAPYPPLRQRILLPSNLDCLPDKLRPFSEALIVDAGTMGIKNMVLYLDAKAEENRDLYHSPVAASPSVPPMLHIRDCVFSPHLTLLREGQKLRIRNDDPFGHNPNLVFFKNPPVTRALPAEMEIDVAVEAGELAPTPVYCPLHPWMKAYVLAFNHPYVGISDEQGWLTIEHLPVGRPITFRLWHESMRKSFETLEVRGQAQKLDNGRLTVQLEARDNDLGIVRLAPGSFDNQ